MARAARDSLHQAARAGLLAALATACATVQDPPGGPPDFEPPTLISVRPDSGAVLERFDGRVEYQFSEVITEPTGQAAARLFVVSPRPRELDVDWSRTKLSVKPKDGWRRGAVYRLTLLPQVTDLRNNRLESGRVIVFAIGAPIPDTRITGTVVDWEAGRTVRQALVEAVALPDSLVYFTLADSSGRFALEAVPPGRYTLYGSADANNNRIRDRGELFDSTTVVLDTALAQTFWAFRQDTTGPQIQNTERLDTLTIRVVFTQPLAPAPVDPIVLSVFALPDTTPVAIDTILRPAEYDSLRAAERARARAQADSARLAADTTAQDTVPTPVVPPAPVPAPDTVPQPLDSAQIAVNELLGERPPLISQLVIRLATPMTPGARFLITSRAANPLGIVAESRSVVIVPSGDNR